MKNRRVILKIMNEQDTDYKFTIPDLVEWTGLKKSQIDYEMKLMLKKDIVDKMYDVDDFRRTIYVRSKGFDEAYDES